MSEQAKTNVTISVISAIVGFAITFGTTIWYAAQKDANYQSRINYIERDLESLDARLDTSEAFRASIVTDLAEIKTDLLWIRKTLEHGKN
jgi:hypothetical protein